MFLIVVSDTTRNLPPTQSSTSHHPPGAVSYNVTLHQHQAPPGAYGGKAGDHRKAEARGSEQGDQSDKRNQGNNNSTRENSSSKFPYKVYEMSSDDDAGKGDQSEFAFREFSRLDVLLNLSLIHRKRALDISRYLIEIGKTTIETGLRMVQIHSGNKTQTENFKSTVKIGRRLISAGKKILARGEKVLKAVLHPTSEKPLKAHEPNIPATRISDLQVVTPVIKMISLCSHGPSYYGVTLLGGIRAGHFVSHGRVDNMQACIKKCCANQECDLAFMVKEDCYSVICYHKSLCRSVRAQHIKKYKPRIAHIWRGSNKEKERVTGHFRSRQPSRKHMKSTGKGKLAIVKHKDLKSVTRDVMSRPVSQNRMRKTKARKRKMTQAQHYREKVARTQILANDFDSHLSSSMSNFHSSTDERSRLNATQGLTQKSYSRSSQGQTASKTLVIKPSTPIESSKKDSRIIKESIKVTSSTRRSHSSGLKEANFTVHKDTTSEKYPVEKKSNNACPHSPIEHNVGLRHGLKTGKFSYIGELFEIEKCLDVCCDEPDCDIAFMLDQSCYMVNCTTESMCRSVPYHQHQYSTRAVFVLRRFNKHKSGFDSIQRVASLGRSTMPTLSSHKAFTKGSVVTPTVAQVTNIETEHNSASPLQDSDVENGPELWQDEKIKINFTGAQHSTPKGNEFDLVEIKSNKSADENWKNEKIRVHLVNVDNAESRPSSLRQKSNLTLEHSDRLISGKSHVDARNKVPKTNSKPHVLVTSHNYLTESEEKLESSSEKENDVGRKGSNTNESAVYHKYSLKIKVALGSGDSSLQGEPDYYKSQSQTSKFFDPYAHKNSELVTKTAENSGRAGSGMSGSAELETGSDFDTSSAQYETGSSLYETGFTFDSSSAESASQNCSSYSYYNVTLQGGVQAGNFTFAGRVSSKEDCVTRCCSTVGCDLTFMVLDRCFLVDCYGDDLCDVTEARNADKFEPVISYVNLTIIDTLVARSIENSGLMSIEKNDNSYVNQTSSEKEDRSHDVGEIKTVTTNRVHNTPWTHDTVLQTDMHQSGCLYSAPFHNISFRQGRQAGLFTNHGNAKNIHECSQWCCQSKHCDVAFMLSKDCFFVRCHSNKSCDTFTIHGSKFNPRMVFVKKQRVQLDAQRENSTRNTSNGVTNQPGSFQSSEFIPTSAAIFTVNKSSDYYGYLISSASLSLSAADQLAVPYGPIASKAAGLDVNSPVASGTSEDDTSPEATQPVPKDDPSNFVEVKTNGSEFWWQFYKPEGINLSNSSFKVELPDVSESTRNYAAIASSRSASPTVRGTHSHNQEQELCNRAKIVNGVTLTGGYYAGIFSMQENVTSMKQCISRCCCLSKCNVAFMVSKICYVVQCFSNEKCTTVKAHYARRYHPQVSYVRQGPIDTSLDEVKHHVTDHDLVTDKLRCVLDDISGAKYTVPKGSALVHSSAQDLGDCAKLCCQTRGCEVALVDNGTCFSLNCHGNLTCPNTNLSRDEQFFSRSVVVIKDLLHSQTNSEGVETEACDFSNVLHEVVLRGGSQSGKFKYLIEVENMDTCIRECCRHKVCDLALMLKDNCFLVSCHNEMLCDPIPSRSSDYHPQIAYKIKHGKRRHIGKEVSYLHSIQTV